MNFNKLVEFWSACLVDDFENEEFASAYKKANAAFKRADVPGGCPLYDHQEMVIDEDIQAFVDGKAGGTGWDNFINFRPTSRKSRAARIAAKRKLVPEVPEPMFRKSLRVRFGWELIQLPIDWEKFNGVMLRPRLTKHDDLSKSYFEEWLKLFDDLEKGQRRILLGLSGPRIESFTSIVLGDNWRTRYYSI